MNINLKDIKIISIGEPKENTHTFQCQVIQPIMDINHSKGCALSKIKAVQKYLKNGLPILILQNDAQKTQWYKNQLNIPENTDIIRIGYSIAHHLQRNHIRVNKEYYKLTYGSGGDHATLIITEKGKQQWINRSNCALSKNRASDSCWSYISQRCNILYTSKPMFFQGGIRNQNQKYTKTCLSSYYQNDYQVLEKKTEIQNRLKNTIWKQYNDGKYCCDKIFLENGKMSYGPEWKIRQNGLIEFDGHNVYLNANNQLIGVHNSGCKLKYINKIQIDKKLKTTVVILSWKRPQNVYKILEKYKSYNCVQQIIVWNNNKDIKIEQRQKTKIINNVEDFGLDARFIASEMSKTQSVFFNDDDILLEEQSIQLLINKWYEDKKIIHGVFGRDPKIDGSYAIYYDNIDLECNIIGTASMILDRKYANLLIKERQREEIKQVMKKCVQRQTHKHNGQDILFSYLVIKESNRKNKIHKVQYQWLNRHDAVSDTKGHYQCRTIMLKTCESLYVNKFKYSSMGMTINLKNIKTIMIGKKQIDKSKMNCLYINPVYHNLSLNKNINHAYGCAAAHKNAAIQSLSYIEPCLILEQDATPCKFLLDQDFNIPIKQLENVDILYLGYTKFNSKFKYFNQFFSYNLSGVAGTHAVLLITEKAKHKWIQWCETCIRGCKNGKHTAIDGVSSQFSIKNKQIVSLWYNEVCFFQSGTYQNQTKNIIKQIKQFKSDINFIELEKKDIENSQWYQYNDEVFCCIKQFKENNKMISGDKYYIDKNFIQFSGHTVRPISKNTLIGRHQSEINLRYQRVGFYSYQIQRRDKNNQKKIPKIIHTCWMSGQELPELQKKCLESWKRYCPDYEIKIWTSENWNVNKNIFAKQAFENKQWAFVSDVVRLDVLYEYGGIYLDFDVQIKKNIDLFLQDQFFTGSSYSPNIHTSTPFILGSQKNNSLIKKLLNFYNNKSFIKTDGTFERTVNTIHIQKDLLEIGVINKDCYQEFLPNHKKYPSYILGYKSSETYMIHHCEGYWRKQSDKKQQTLKQKITFIYQKNSWTNGSGIGSTVQYTKQYRIFLQNYLKDNNIKSVLDIGCGDWQFSKLINWDNINYLGIDLVDMLVKKNIQLYKKSNIDFKIGNILQEDFEEFDLIVIKDVLQHLSNKNVKIVLQKLKKHNKVLITNDIGDNRDIKDGEFRYLDVRLNPFNLQCFQVFNFGKNNKVTLQYSKQQNKFDDILKLLKNVNEKISTERYGPNEDGGYIVPSGIKFNKMITIGVGHDVRFQKDYQVKNGNIQISFYDPTVNNLPENITNSKFNKIGLGNRIGYKKLQEIIQQNNIKENDKVLLKIDCQGGQWDCDFQKTNLSKIHSIVVEIHDLHLKNNWNNYEIVLQKIYNQFQCVNLHPNNYGGVFLYKNIQIPKVIQLTFINKKDVDLNLHLLRAKNFPNNKSLKQIYF